MFRVTRILPCREVDRMPNAAAGFRDLLGGGRPPAERLGDMIRSAADPHGHSRLEATACVLM